MLRQLARLTLAVPEAGPNAVALAVYADGGDRPIPAAETGFEGVACVDDAARGIGLFCDLWEATRVPLFRGWALGLLDFVLYMQADDGRFINFIVDRRGTRNESGPTSVAGGGFWHARAMRGLAKADVAFEDPRARAAFARGMGRMRDPETRPDVRSVHVRTALGLMRSGRRTTLEHDVAGWCAEIAAARDGDVLLDDRAGVPPHLWGHSQEATLAEAGFYLGRPDLVEVARRSAMAYLVPLIRSGFDDRTVQPYGVACALDAVEQLSIATGEQIFEECAARARAWFDGSHGTGPVVYDAERGRVHDGIDDGVLNDDSGAESNIVGASALFRRVAFAAGPLLPAIRAAFAPDLGRPRLRGDDRGVLASRSRT